MDDEQRSAADLEARLARLEARISRLEGVLQPSGAPPRAPVLPAPALAQTPTPAPTPVLGWRPPTSAWREVPTPAGPGWASPPKVPRSSGGRPTIHLPTVDLTGSWAEIEQRLAGRALAWVGGIALILGAIFFLSLAFSRDWIGPEARVLLGLTAGTVALAGGWVLLERRNVLLGNVLVPVGIAVITVSLVGATSLYHLIPPAIGLLGALIAAMTTAVLAVRRDTQLIAAYGLVAVLLAPPLMGAPPDLATLAFVAIVLVGTTSIALWRAWWWLPPVAFLLAAPQLAAWIMGDPDPAQALVAISGFWLLNAVAAGGEAFRHRRDDLAGTSATLLVVDAAFTVGMGFTVLTGDLTGYRAYFLVLLALANLGIAAWFFLRDGDLSLFGMLAAGTGVAALTMAAPVGLGAEVVPVAWTAEAVVLAWIAVRRGHPVSALAAAALFILAAGGVIREFETLGAASFGPPSSDAAWMLLAFFLGGVAVGLWVARDRRVRSGLAALGLFVAALCASMALGPELTVVASIFLAVVGTATWRALPFLPSDSVPWRFDGPLGELVRERLPAGPDARATSLALLPIAVAYAVATATYGLMWPVWNHIDASASSAPFVSVQGAVLASYLVGLAAIALISGQSRLREPLAATGLIVIGRACIAELSDLWLVAAWSALMVVSMAVWRGLARLPHDRPLRVWRPAAGTRLSTIDWTSDLVLPAVSLVFGFGALAHVLASELPFRAFGRVLPPEVPFTDAGAVAAAVLVVATLATGAIVGGRLAMRVAGIVSIAIVAYTVPYEVYAWAVCVLWVGLGALALGLIRVDPEGRAGWRVVDALLVGGSSFVLIGIVSLPSRVVVGLDQLPTAMQGAQSLAAGAAVVIGLALLADEGRTERWVRWCWTAAGVALVYTLSVAVMDVVSLRSGTVPLEELRFQGGVALSVLWTILGVIALVAGLRSRNDDLRRGGLVLLGLATLKVFLVDLANLDVAYRVISLVVLGLVLLAAAWLWQRSQPKPPIHGSLPGGSAGAA